jgi:hypothetical protein
MHSLVAISGYVGGAAALLGAGLIGLSLLKSPSLSNAINALRSGDWKAATGGQTQARAPVDGSAFRYGPEIDHGRSDTPVFAAAQALREARATPAPDINRKQSYRGRIARGSAARLSFNRGLSTGH